jgi:hypothetical protein
MVPWSTLGFGKGLLPNLFADFDFTGPRPLEIRRAIAVLVRYVIVAVVALDTEFILSAIARVFRDIENQRQLANANELRMV